MKLCSPLLLGLAAALSSAFVISPPHIWTKLILTHHWPSTFCSMEQPVCHPNISYWTLHGLWPDKGIDCNSSWHFNSSQIEDLLPDMKKSWPDLLNSSSASFWKYEWHKHGTCAAKAASLNSQHKYFSKGLELYHKLDLDSILKKFDIIPSETYYKLSQIEGVIENFYNIKPKIQCVHPAKNADVQILGQIEICFNPDFTLMDCEKQFTTEKMSKGDWHNLIADDKASGFSVCDHDMPVYYPPPS
ncbi:ribonuclease T2 [Anarrhichthys ocellatus]|uniref:ribonuclease T2 n=1 Tax=Anarrhichthys ocellatus TaxID=433405 RepID=UPI0012EDD6DE|nr:ribonuclease T2 [Anarrhichthys ocellatus]